MKLKVRVKLVVINIVYDQVKLILYKVILLVYDFDENFIVVIKLNLFY